MRALLAAACLVLSVPAGAGGAPPAAHPDVTAPGPHTVTEVGYDAGLTVVTGTSGEVWLVGLTGRLYVPSGTAPAPVVLFLHGHWSGDCDGEPTGDPVTDLQDGCVGTPLPHETGFGYVARNLASHGYLVASVRDERWLSGPSTSLVTDPAAQRAGLLLHTLDKLAEWHAAPGPGAVGTALVGRVDLGRIGAVGHSRGGDGVAALATVAAERPAGRRYDIGAVFAIAPTDSRRYQPHGRRFAVLLPTCDGEVYTLEGARMWDRGRFVDPADPAPRSQFVVRGANHNWFNEVWEPDDAYAPGVHDDPACDPTSAATVRLGPEDQRRVGLALVAGFLRRHLGGEAAFDGLMTGADPLPASACPGGVAPCPDVLGTSYLAPAAHRALVLTPLDDTLPAATEQGGPLAFRGFAEARVCDPAPATDRAGVVLELVTGPRPTGCPSEPTRSAARQVVLRWDGPAVLEAGLAPGGFDARRFTAVTFRAGVNFPAYGSPAPAVDVVLRDTGGRTATVTVSGGQALTEPAGPDERELVLNGVRAPLAAFRGVRLDRLAAVELRFGATGPGSLQLAELAFQVS